MGVTKEAGYGDETEEAGDAAGAVKSTERLAPQEFDSARG